MLLDTIVFDAAMSVQAVRSRFARNGLWLDPQQMQAQEWINERAIALGSSVVDIAARLRHDPRGFAVAIRRQWNANVLWYSRSAEAVLIACSTAESGTLQEVLQLDETDSEATLTLPVVGLPPAVGRAAIGTGIVLEGGMPVAVGTTDAGGKNVFQSEPPPSLFPGSGSGYGSDYYHGSGVGRGALRPPTPAPAPAPPAALAPATGDIHGWPRLDAPSYVPARVPFTVVLGLAATPDANVSGGEIRIPLAEGAAGLDLTVSLIAGGVDALDGWTKALHIERAAPTAATVAFSLIGREPSGPEPVHLTTLEARFVHQGAVCGTASRPLIIGRATERYLSAQPGDGTSWLAQPATATPLDLQQGQPVADLTIELAKPDRNYANGRYVCQLLTPHPILIDASPHEIDLGDDAKTFARYLVDQVRQFSKDPIVDSALTAAGNLVAEKLPPAVFDALRGVSARVAPDPPTVLIVSADPYVPWELARLQTPLDATRPPYLGAQTIMGRWLRDPAAPAPKTAGTPAAGVVAVGKPPGQPPATIGVRNMAVMVGLYRADSGLRALPGAEAEGAALVQNHDAIPLAASTQALKQLLDAKLEHRFQQVGGADAVHFAGHGEFDPARPDSAVLYLTNGYPLSSLLFRSAHYGGAQQPLLFLNACMIGIGGELLGDMGGFPGNCLRGGFGGMVGALWEIDDEVAAKIALEFWRRALPANADAAEPVGAILRDVRARYSPGTDGVPVSTYLSYVYYGHPLLKLERRA
jgi:hypothetical protein